VLLTLGIDQLTTEAKRTRGDISARLRALSDTAGEIASDVHRLSYQLHPAKLEVLGLVAAIDSHCREVLAQHQVSVEFDHSNVPSSIPPDVALSLFRIVQEGLHNVVKHSGSRKAAVRLTAAEGQLLLHIADPGRGFVPVAADRTGLGLVSMRERVNFLGGDIVIHSAPGAGTRIGVRVPLGSPASTTRQSRSVARSASSSGSLASSPMPRFRSTTRGGE
jgi:signal transduction histidine kinase